MNLDQSSRILYNFFFLVLSVSSLALRSDETDEEILSQRSLDGLADTLSMLSKELRRTDHPFGFGIGNNGYSGKKRSFKPVMSTHAFHGRKDESRSISSEGHDTSIFHGKRSLIEDNNSEDFPSSTSAFHGKRDMRALIKMLLTDLERERVKKNTQMK